MNKLTLLRTRRYLCTAALCAIVHFDQNVQAQPVSIDAGRSLIVQHAGATKYEDRYLQRAAGELQLHLNLVTGVQPEIVSPEEIKEGFYLFHIGAPAPASAGTALTEQECRWVTDASATYLFGVGNQGTLNAVYSFLQDQLEIDWVAPGLQGIVWSVRNPMVLKTGDFNWIPKLQARGIRQGVRKIKGDVKPHSSMLPFADFIPSVEAYNDYVDEVVQWKDRMRMGGKRPGGAHAFSSWWGKYGESNPEYFALNKFGKREPVPLPKADQTDAFIKICPSNPKVVEQLIANWLPVKERVRYIDAGVNDGVENFCECDNCRALDAPLEGEKWDDHLTDRYVYLANAVAREARKHRPDAMVTIYAYIKTLYPPRRLKLEPNIVVQLVPYVDPLDLDEVREHFEGWRKAGATQLALRPNYHHKYLTSHMPLGIEKQMFDVFQLAVENGCISTDYDSLFNNWPVTGLSDFVLARSMAEPELPFETLAARYYRAFGAAADDVKAYFEYWRNEVWEKRLQPELIAICRAGGAGDFIRGLFWSLNKYYTDDDFEKAKAILGRAGNHNLQDGERTRLTQLQLANEHAHLIYRAVVASPYEKSEHAEVLLKFRRRHMQDLPLQWVHLFNFELGNGDLTGLQIADTMRDYIKPWLQTDLFWKFRLDPDDVGLQEKWYELGAADFESWLNFRTDRFWEQQYEPDEQHDLPEEVARVIFSYDGIGWYSTEVEVPGDWKDREVILRFGAVDESCWVYCNGQKAGEHIYKNTNDWKTPFEIRIDPFVNWDKAQQRIVVRVEDKSGVGGIWRRVWLVSKKGD